MEYKLIINFKTYVESFNEDGMKIANICLDLEKLANSKNVDLIVSVNVLDLKDIAKSKVKTYAQHIDNFNFGAHSGFIIPQAVKKLGVLGTLINHSEHRLNFSEIKEKIEICKNLELETCLCVENSEEVKDYSILKPNFIAIEPKELIGGDISISTAKPELIEDSVKNSNGVPILVGAGVKNSKDVKVAIQLGAKGILVASGVVKVDDIKSSIIDLLDGF